VETCSREHFRDLPLSLAGQSTELRAPTFFHEKAASGQAQKTQLGGESSGENNTFRRASIRTLGEPLKLGSVRRRRSYASDSESRSSLHC
jgi:hypothetical protein